MEFSPDKLGKFGVRSTCRPCQSRIVLEARQVSARKRDLARAANKRWYLQNREEILVQTADQRAAYRKANPERSRAGTARYKARKKGAPVNDFTTSEWLEVLAEFNHSCAYCLRTDRPLQQEHMQPISRGGSHTRLNVIPACRDCNFRKQTKTPLEFLAVGGGTALWQT